MCIHFACSFSIFENSKLKNFSKKNQTVRVKNEKEICMKFVKCALFFWIIFKFANTSNYRFYKFDNSEFKIVIFVLKNTIVSDEYSEAWYSKLLFSRFLSMLKFTQAHFYIWNFAVNNSEHPHSKFFRR